MNKALWLYRELTEPRIRTGIRSRCDHLHECEGGYVYSKLLTLIKIWHIAILRCDVCKAKVVRWQ